MEICRHAEGRSCPAEKAVVRIGELRGSAVQVIISGTCAMYLDESDSSISSQLFATSSAQSHELVSTPRQAPSKSSGLRAATARRNALDHTTKSGVHTLTQMRLEPGDAIGAQRAFHNCDAERVVQEGFRDASHTVVALEETFCMAIVLPGHIVAIAEASRQSRDEKVRILRAMQLYANCTTASLRRMADVMVRKWYPADATVVTEGGTSEAVFFTVKGQLRVVKNAGTPAQTTVNVMGSGSCFGDLGVLTQMPRSHSIIAVKSCQLLSMSSPSAKHVYPTLS